MLKQFYNYIPYVPKVTWRHWRYKIGPIKLSEIKTTVLELKNTLDEMTSRFMLQKKKVNELEDTAIENLQNEIWREKKIKKK